MNRVSRIVHIVVGAGIVAALATSAAAQDTARAQGPGARGGGGRGAAQLPADALNGVTEALRELERSYAIALRIGPAEPVVRDAPYSGTGTTTTTQVLTDGTRIERSTTTRIWRDRLGRVRREQMAIGLGALSPDSDAATVVTITDPVAGVSHTLDQTARTARSTPMPNAGRGGRAGGAPMPGLAGAPVESLGTREIDGVKAVGRRTSRTIPLGQIGNDRPFDVTYEVWESPDLQIILESRQNDPRTGIVEYRVTGLTRAEPPPDLFAVPGGYTVVNQPTLQPSWTVAPGAGARGRGRSNSVDQFGTPDGN